MKKERLMELAGVDQLTEGKKFKDAGETLRAVLKDFRTLADMVDDKVFAEDIRRILSKYENAEVNTNR